MSGACATAAWGQPAAQTPKPKLQVCAPYEGSLASDPQPLQPIAFAPKALDGLEGSYQFLPDLMLTITRKGDRLFAGLGDDTAELFATAGGRFFMKEDSLQIVFQRAAPGQATCLVVVKDGDAKLLPRVE